MSTRPTAEMPAMSDYGVQTGTWKPLDWEWAAERLVPVRNYWLATADSYGRTHCMPVWGVWDDGDLRFAFGCSPNARKARDIAVNPYVTITNDDTVECVSVQGTATLTDDAESLDRWADRFVAKYGHEIGPEYGDFVRSHPLYVVTPSVAFGMIERTDDFATRATRWRFA
jgi:hypothetical protein